MEREETTTAVVERVSREVVVCRYKRRARVDAISITENLDARLRFRGREPYAVVAIFPEDVDLHMPLLEQNYYTDMHLNEITKLLALVVEGALFSSVAQMYLTLHPTTFASKVFRTEGEAMEWVNGQIEVRQRRR